MKLRSSAVVKVFTFEIKLFVVIHRRDSDVYQPYNTVAKVLGELQGKFKDTDDVGVSSTTKRKKYNALWIVSNCHLTKGSVRRLKIVEKMVAAGIDIDRRGKVEQFLILIYCVGTPLTR